MSAAAAVSEVKCRQVAVLIDSAPTDIVISEYADRFFIIVTQRQKIGSLIHATHDSSNLGPHSPFSVNILLGQRDDPMLTLLARQLIADICKTSAKSLLLGVALNKQSQTLISLRTVLAVVLANKPWG